MKTFDISDIPSIIEDIEKKSIQACQNTVNTQAALTRKNAIERISNDFTLRNQWTTRGSNLNYTQCPRSVTSISDIQSEVGSTLDYMERQEKGGVHNPKQGKQLAIPSTMARGGNNSKKVLYRFNYSNIKTVGKSLHQKTRSAQYVARAFVSFKNGAFMTLTKTLYQITKFRKTGDKITFTQTPIYNLKFKKTITPPKPWLEPSTLGPAADGQAIFNAQLDKLYK